MQKKKKFRKRLIVFSLIFCFCVFFIFQYLISVVNPIIFVYGESEISKLLVTSCNNAILNISSINYDDLIEIEHGIDGKISAIFANSSRINNLANSLAIESQREIDLHAKLGISIPFGTCTGIGFLSGKGSAVSFSVTPIGNVTSEFYTSFRSVGINQTSHKIFVSINSEAALILPFGTKMVRKNIDYLVTECLIVGEVPATYLNISTLGELYK